MFPVSSCVKWCLLPLLAASISATSLQARDNERIPIEGTTLSLTLGDGWAESDRNADQVLAGFESSDERSSIFITEASAGGRMSMTEIMESTIANFEKAFTLETVGEIKDGPLAGGGVAIYCTLDLEMKTAKKPIPFRFYLYLCDTGEGLYLFQGSTMKPVREVREREILATIRSIQHSE